MFNIRLDSPWDNDDEWINNKLMFEDTAYHRDRLVLADSEDEDSDTVYIIYLYCNILIIY
jgi:hypothetical protein